MGVLGMLAWSAGGASLCLGARRYAFAEGSARGGVPRGEHSAVERAYRWLALGAALYCAGLVVTEILGGTPNPAPGLSFLDLLPLLTLVAAAAGTVTLTTAEPGGGGPACPVSPWRSATRGRWAGGGGAATWASRRSSCRWSRRGGWGWPGGGCPRSWGPAGPAGPRDRPWRPSSPCWQPRPPPWW